MAEPQVTAQSAREFLGNFGHSPDALKGMADADVLKLHGTVSGYHGKAVAEAVAKAGNGNGAWPADWREKLSAGDAKKMDTLGRFQDPGAMWTSYEALRQKMSSGELKAVTPFPEKGTPEEQGAWRKANGIPEKAEEYDTRLDGGLVIGEDDKPLVDSFLKHAHAAHMPQGFAKQALQWYFGSYLQDSEKARADADGEFRAQSTDVLRSTWGADYKRNIGAIKALVDGAPEALRERLWGARLSDGKALGDDPDMLRWLADLSLQINPNVTLVPGDATTQLNTIEGELRDIEKTMRTNRREYNKDEKKQARYRDLLDAYQRIAGKAWA